MHFKTKKPYNNYSLTKDGNNFNYFKKINPVKLYLRIKT